MSPRRTGLEVWLLVAFTVAVSEVASAWEPYNLTARVIDGNDGYNTLEITWSPGECGRFDESSIVIMRDNVARNQTVGTARGLATFEDCEYWSQYEVILQAGSACFREELHAFIKTGPGQPHRPKGIRVTPRETSADFTIAEAFMPRELSGYSLQLCRTEVNAANECKTESFMNHTSSDGFQNGTFTNLEPESTYTYKVTPVIIDGTRNYMGFSLTGSFNTTSLELPEIVDVDIEFKEENSTLSAAITWKLSEPNFPVKLYFVTAEPCSPACARLTATPEVNFTNLKFSSPTKLEIRAAFLIENKMRVKSYVFDMSTPNYVAPIAALEVADMSPFDSFVRWPPTEKHSEYEITICSDGSCSFARQEYSEMHLITKKPGAVLDVSIKVHQENFTADYFNGRLQMLEKDYETPRIVSIDPESTLWNRVIYKVDARVASKISLFEIEACSLSGERKDCHHVTAVNISAAKLTLDYFQRYEIEVTAVVKLPCDKEVRKSSKKTINTVGTDPEAVEDIVASNVTSDSFDLRWKPSKNVPTPVEGFLNVFYEISTQSANWTTKEPYAHLPNLSPYTEYDVSVLAKVLYQGETLVGKVAHAVVKTDSGKPGKVRNLRVLQRLHSPTVGVMFEPPVDENGEVDHYLVAFGSLTSDAAKQWMRVNSTQTNLTLPVTQNDTDYFFDAVAVNINSMRKELLGEPSEINVTVPGIGLTFNVSLIGVTSHSLQLLLESSDDREKQKQHFFTVTDSRNRTIKTSLKLVTVEDLPPYHQELLRIKACYADDFCTKAMIFEALTDVDVPSAVVGLTATVANRTNVEISFGYPETKNGPVDGFVLEIVDETDPTLAPIHAEIDKTHYVYNSTDEFESFRISVRDFNKHVNDPSEKIYGPTKTVKIRTSGFSVPKVENLTIISVDDKSISIAWSRPGTDIRENIFYKVALFESDVKASTTQNLSATISGLKPYVNYTFGVHSCTGDPAAPSCGLPRRLNGTTDAAAPSKPRNLTVRILDDHTADISWEIPESTNGEIAAYTLSIKNSTDTAFVYLNGSVLYHKAEGLKPSETYHLTVVAHVYNKHHDRLDSEPATTDFTTGHSSNVLEIVLIIAGILMLLGAIIGSVFWYRRPINVPYGPIGPDP